jgi:hypothetical protein
VASGDGGPGGVGGGRGGAGGGAGATQVAAHADWLALWPPGDGKQLKLTVSHAYLTGGGTGVGGGGGVGGAGGGVDGTVQLLRQVLIPAPGLHV